MLYSDLLFSVAFFSGPQDIYSLHFPPYPASAAGFLFSPWPVILEVLRAAFLSPLFSPWVTLLVVSSSLMASSTTYEVMIPKFQPSACITLLTSGLVCSRAYLASPHQCWLEISKCKGFKTDFLGSPQSCFTHNSFHLGWWQCQPSRCPG